MHDRQSREEEYISAVENPRFLRKASEKIEKFQQELSRKKLRSNNRKKVKIQLSRIHKKVANKRLDFMHKESCKLVEYSKRIITEKLTIKNITKAPKAKIDEVSGAYLPNGAKAKAGLNKSILDTSPSQFLKMIDVKAEEAGYRLEELEIDKDYTITHLQKIVYRGVDRYVLKIKENNNTYLSNYFLEQEFKNKSIPQEHFKFRAVKIKTTPKKNKELYVVI